MSCARRQHTYQLGGSKGSALSMVACGGGDDAARQLLRRQAGHLVEGPPQLERKHLRAAAGAWHEAPIPAPIHVIFTETLPHFKCLLEKLLLIGSQHAKECSLSPVGGPPSSRTACCSAKASSQLPAPREFRPASPLRLKFITRRCNLASSSHGTLYHCGYRREGLWQALTATSYTLAVRIPLRYPPG